MEEPKTGVVIDSSATPVDRNAIGAILRPPIMLWLIWFLVPGMVTIVGGMMLALQVSSWPWLLYRILSGAGQIAVAAITLKFVWRVPEARRVFRKAPKRVVELCIVSAVVAALAFKMWYGWVAGDLATAGGAGLVSGLGLAWLLLAHALLPALLEELMCRGLMLHQFRQAMSLPLANALQAMLFASMHPDADVVILYFGFAYVLGIIRLKSGVLWPSMAINAVWSVGVLLTTYGFM